MDQKVRDIFNEEEWQALSDNTEELSSKVKELPKHIEIDQDRMIDNNE